MTARTNCALIVATSIVEKGGTVMPVTTMTVEDWLNTYKPLVNHLDSNASWQDGDGRGVMFETYGAEVEFVLDCEPLCVWTYLAGDDGNDFVTNGYHLVNRIGYFVTQKPAPDDAVIEVILD